MKKTISRILAMALVVCLMACMLPCAFATSANTEVNDAAKGVLQIITSYRFNDGETVAFQNGSAFLINDNTIVTCNHNLVPDAEMMEVLTALENRTEAEVMDRLVYSVTVTRDITISATVMRSSSEMDFAIMRLETSLQDREPIEIRSSSSVQLTETVYAIGFPGQSAAFQAINKYTSADVTITSGLVNKIATGAGAVTGADYDYIQTGCKMAPANSGGPLVDTNGNVIGICQFTSGDDASLDDYYYAIAIDQVTEVCNALGIVWTSADETSEPEPVATTPATEAQSEEEETVDTSRLAALISEAQALNADEYSTESYSAMTNALNSAVSVLYNTASTQAEVDAAMSTLNNAKANLNPAEKSNMTMIILIAGAVAVVLVVVVVVVVSANNKKKAQAAAAAAVRTPAHAAPVSATTGFAPSNMSVAPAAKPANTAPVSGAGETTILNQGAGETTVLSQAIKGGTLTRRNGEKIEINAAEFTLGRERSRVSYCITNNTSISRVHAKLVVRNGVTYLVDLGAANGTFVNGVKANANQEIALKDGDKVTLADEEFAFKA